MTVSYQLRVEEQLLSLRGRDAVQGQCCQPEKALIFPCLLSIMTNVAHYLLPQPQVTSSSLPIFEAPQMFAYSPNFLAESPSVETLRELEEYIDAAISGPQHNAPELKLCYHSHSSSTALSSLDNNNSSGSGAADSSLDTRQFQDGRSDQLRVPDGKLIAGMQWLLVSLALMVSNFLYGMNATMIGNAQLFITEEFGEVAKLGWIGVSFALGATISVLPLSKAMNVFDNKWLCINCLGMYAAAVGLCGGAPSMNVAIIGRIWAGATGTGLFMM
jgi:hypothetical protein